MSDVLPTIVPANSQNIIRSMAIPPNEAFCDKPLKPHLPDANQVPLLAARMNCVHMYIIQACAPGSTKKGLTGQLPERSSGPQPGPSVHKMHKTHIEFMHINHSYEKTYVHNDACIKTFSRPHIASCTAIPSPLRPQNPHAVLPPHPQETAILNDLNSR
jgi:hypothetical protein